jgi:hypothetical protein
MNKRTTKHETASVHQELWPNDLDAWAPETPSPEDSSAAAVLFVHKGQLLLNCADRYYSGAIKEEDVRKLLCMCATVLAKDTERLFEYGEEQNMLSVRDDGSVGVIVSDDHYSGQLSSAYAFKLALQILRQR